MRHVLLYEFTTGGGFFSIGSGREPDGSLLREGTAMTAALAEDLLAIPDVTLTLLCDVRLERSLVAKSQAWVSNADSGERAPAEAGEATHKAGAPEASAYGSHRHTVEAREAIPPSGRLRWVEIDSAHDEEQSLRCIAADADAVILIAPEFENLLLNRCLIVEEVGGRLLSPSSEFVRIASDKNTAAGRFVENGVPVPHGIAWNPLDPLPQAFPYPAVIKPHDGAGSMGVQRIDNAGSPLDVTVLGRVARMEKYCVGQPASVAMLCGPAGPRPLPPCSQRMAADGSFAYLGGRVPLDQPLGCRATQIARRAVAALPAAVGYVGVDILLGQDDRGEDDYVIEVNPRLTTSYVGLRRLCRGNLALAMLQAADGQTPTLDFLQGSIEFSEDGQTFENGQPCRLEGEVYELCCCRHRGR